MSDIDRALFLLCHVGISIHHLNKKSEKNLGLSLVQWCLLKNLIDLPGASAHLLSKAVGVHPSTLTQTLKRLEKKNLVFITNDPRDSRKKLISITRSGKDLLQKTSSEMDIWLQDLVPFIGELQQVNHQLKK